MNIETISAFNKEKETFHCRGGFMQRSLVRKGDDYDENFSKWFSSLPIA